MEETPNLTAGMLWGTLLSIPLWMALVGWIQIMADLM